MVDSASWIGDVLPFLGDEEVKVLSSREVLRRLPAHRPSIKEDDRGEVGREYGG